jgi:hypothetical protein
MHLRSIFAIGLTLLTAGTVSAQINDEYRVKAAFLYNFAKFVEWPHDAWSSPADPVTLCVVGKSPFGDALTQVVEGKSVQGRPMCLRQIQDAGAAGNCRILFISDSERKRILTILGAVRGRGVLTVGESPGFAASGGVINFKIDGGHVRFEINLAAADEQKLTISSKLLSLAEVLRK